MLAMHLRGDAFTPEQKARNFAYYEPLTVRDSSLSACTQAVIAAEVGHLDLAYDYLAEAALIDLQRPGAQHRRTACTSRRWPGTWIARRRRVRRHASATPTGCAFAPRLPPALSRISFGLGWQGRQLRVEITRGGGGVPAGRRRRRCGCAHHGEQVALADAPGGAPDPDPLNRSSRSSSRTAGRPGRATPAAEGDPLVRS